MCWARALFPTPAPREAIASGFAVLVSANHPIDPTPSFQVRAFSLQHLPDSVGVFLKALVNPHAASYATAAHPAWGGSGCSSAGGSLSAIVGLAVLGLLRRRGRQTHSERRPQVTLRHLDQV